MLTQTMFAKSAVQDVSLAPTAQLTAPLAILQALTSTSMITTATLAARVELIR
jgi:hypothetical protein